MAKRHQEYQRRILRLLRSKGEASRPALARALDLSLPTITNIVKQLLEHGVVMEADYKQSTGGRRAALLQLNPDHAHAVGVEVSHSSVRAARINLVGEIVDQEETPLLSPGPQEPDLERIVAVARAVVERAPEGVVVGLGVGISGIVSSREGVSVKFPRSEKWVDVPLVSILSERLGPPTWLENDVQAATLGELRFGDGRLVKNFAYLHLGEGIALGIVADGRLYEGANGNVGELGHSIIEPDGPICYCGNYGCLESLASPAAIVRQAQEAITEAGVESRVLNLAGGDLSALTVDHIFEAAEGGDRLASNLVEKAAGYVGLSAANLVNVLTPELLLLAGAMVERGGLVMDAITRSFRSLVMPSLREVTELRKSHLGREARVLGAAALVFDAMMESYPEPATKVNAAAETLRREAGPDDSGQ